jgi:hypothetical protein
MIEQLEKCFSRLSEEGREEALTYMRWLEHEEATRAAKAATDTDQNGAQMVQDPVNEENARAAIGESIERLGLADLVALAVLADSLAGGQ